MSELAEEFREMREHHQEMRRENHKLNIKKLIASGVEFQEFANGHVRIGAYDMWLSTGLFIHRKSKKRGRGIDKLLKLIGKEETP